MRWLPASLMAAAAPSSCQEMSSVIPMAVVATRKKTTRMPMILLESLRRMGSIGLQHAPVAREKKMSQVKKTPPPWPTEGRSGGVKGSAPERRTLGPLAAHDLVGAAHVVEGGGPDVHQAREGEEQEHRHA